MLDQGDQSHSSSVPEAHRQIEFTSDGFNNVLEHSLPIQQQSRTGVPFLNLALASYQTSDRTSISTPTTMSDQGSVRGTTSYFTRNVARTESEVLAKKVVVPKNKRGITSSREFGIHYSKATGALEQVFGAARHFVPTSPDGDTNQPYHNIQAIYVRKLQKLKGVKDQITKYDMVDPFKIPVMVDSDIENPALQWVDETTKRDIFFHW